MHSRWHFKKASKVRSIIGMGLSKWAIAEEWPRRSSKPLGRPRWCLWLNPLDGGDQGAHIYKQSWRHQCHCNSRMVHSRISFGRFVSPHSRNLRQLHGISMQVSIAHVSRTNPLLSMSPRWEICARCARRLYQEEISENDRFRSRYQHDNDRGIVIKW